MAISVRSTFPPEIISPTFFPLKNPGFSLITASTVADDGSMIIFILSHMSFIEFIIESSVAVKISSTFFLIIEKVSSLREVRRPSAIVKGLTEGVRIPVLKDFHASFAFSGSAPITVMFLLIPFAVCRSSAHQSAASNRCNKISRSGYSSRSSSDAVPCPQITLKLS